MAQGPKGVTVVPVTVTGSSKAQITLTPDQVRNIKRAKALAITATQKYGPFADASYSSAFVHVLYAKGKPTRNGKPIKVRDCSALRISANSDLSACLLTGANLSGVLADGIKLNGVVIIGANFSSDTQGDASLKVAGNIAVPLATCDSDSGDFSGCSGTDLTGRSFSGCQADGASFARSTLINADFSDCSLTNTNFNNTWIAATLFYGANLDSATFKGAQTANGSGGPFGNRSAPIGAIFNTSGDGTTVAVLDNADFTQAWLGGSTISAHLQGTKFSNANLQQVRFDGATGFETAIFLNTSFNKTQCPDGKTSVTSVISSNYDGHPCPWTVP